MKIETKFDLGQKVFGIAHSGTHPEKPEPPYFVAKDLVSRIELSRDYYPTRPRYNILNTDGLFEEDELFKTKNEAQLYCDELIKCTDDDEVEQ